MPLVSDCTIQDLHRCLGNLRVDVKKLKKYKLSFEELGRIYLGLLDIGFITKLESRRRSEVMAEMQEKQPLLQVVQFRDRAVKMPA